MPTPKDRSPLLRLTWVGVDTSLQEEEALPFFDALKSASFTNLLLFIGTSEGLVIGLEGNLKFFLLSPSNTSITGEEGSEVTTIKASEWSVGVLVWQVTAMQLALAPIVSKGQKEMG